MAALHSALSGVTAALAAGGPAAGKTVKVGVIADVTGGAGRLRHRRRRTRTISPPTISKAGRIDAGGAKLDFDVQDSASDPAQVVNLTQKFASDGIRAADRPDALVGSEKSRPARGAKPA